MSDLCLAKWYVDAIGPRGEATVGYHVELRWRALSVRLAGVTVLPEDGPPASRLTLRGARAPRLDPESGELRWRSEPLGLDGVWRPVAPRLDERLYEGPSGAVDWRCLMPAARVELGAGGARTPAWGYAERLELTLPPWRLPIEGLRWGRFVGEGASLVWIDWTGSHSRRLLALDGRRLPPGEIGEARVASADGSVELRLVRHRALREAALRDTLGGLAPSLLGKLPERLLGLTERKWIARGTLSAGGRSFEGWALHEQVHWP